MPKSTEPLTPAQVYRFAVAFCQPRLAFRSVGKVTSDRPRDGPLRRRGAHLLHLRDLPPPGRRPGQTTYANALYANLFCLEELKRKVNAAFLAHLPRPSTTPASDRSASASTSPLPYYGQHSLESREIYRAQAKPGTHSFFAYATAYLVLHGQRFTWP